MLSALAAAWQADHPGEPIPDHVSDAALEAWRRGSPDGIQMVLSVWTGLAAAGSGRRKQVATTA